MSDKVLIDTNILVYAFDEAAGTKHEIAANVLIDLWNAKTGVLSMQVLQEFYTTATRKLKVAMPKQRARAVVERFEFWCIPTSPAEISRAFLIEDEARISFWDALIVASAIRAGASRILSEDLNPGQTIAGIKIENPFFGTV